MVVDRHSVHNCLVQKDKRSSSAFFFLRLFQNTNASDHGWCVGSPPSPCFRSLPLLAVQEAQTFCFLPHLSATGRFFAMVKFDFPDKSSD